MFAVSLLNPLVVAKSDEKKKIVQPWPDKPCQLWYTHATTENHPLTGRQASADTQKY